MSKKSKIVTQRAIYPFLASCFPFLSLQPKSPKLSFFHPSCCPRCACTDKQVKRYIIFVIKGYNLKQKKDVKVVTQLSIMTQKCMKILNNVQTALLILFFFDVASSIRVHNYIVFQVTHFHV